MTGAARETLPSPRADLAATLAALPQRRDFAFSAELRRAAWIDEDALCWLDDDSPGEVHRTVPGVALPEGTIVELVDRHCIGLCRPIDEGVELLVVDLAAAGAPVHKIVALASPRTCLVPRPAGETTQILAVTGFDATTALLRIDWPGGTWTEVGRLPARVDGGVWLEPDRRLALNVIGSSERASCYAVDLEAGKFHLLFEASIDSDDRAVLFDSDTQRLVVTTDAPGWPAVGVVGLGEVPERPGVRGVPDQKVVRFLEAMPEGDEGARPCGFVGPPDGRRLLLHHEVGTRVVLRTADLATLDLGDPLPIPGGEMGRVVAADSATVRFSFSAPDLPWGPARLDLATGRFTFDLDHGGAGRPGAAHPALVAGRPVTISGPSGPMPAMVLDPGGTGNLAVVALHGGPIARWGGEYQGELQLFARLGALVVALDYPGSTGWGRAHTHQLFGGAGEIDVEAVASVVDDLGPDRVLLYGESYGAFLALAVAAVRPVAGVAAFAPFFSFSSLKEHGSPEVRETLELLEGRNSDKPGRNLVKGCRTLRSKVLIAHGTADLTIPIRESRELIRALRDGRSAGDNDVRLVELEGQGHDLVGRRVLEQWFRELSGLAEELTRSRSPAQRKNQQQGR